MLHVFHLNAYFFVMIVLKTCKNGCFCKCYTHILGTEHTKTCVYLRFSICFLPFFLLLFHCLMLFLYLNLNLKKCKKRKLAKKIARIIKEKSIKFETKYVHFYEKLHISFQQTTPAWANTIIYFC